MLRLMAGRNGNDQLNRFLLFADVFILLLAMVFNKTLGRFLMPLALIILGIAYFRMFSRNLLRRSEENGKYLIMRSRVQGTLRLWKEQWVQRKDYKFFVCPACRTTLRVPRGRGKIKIVCRKCGNSFTGKS